MVCIGILIINLSSLPMNKLDYRHVEFAKIRCEQIYPDSPCVSRFYKMEENVYRVLCGPKFNPIKQKDN